MRTVGTWGSEPEKENVHELGKKSPNQMSSWIRVFVYSEYRISWNFEK